jgi:hypothetical protein
MDTRNILVRHLSNLPRTSSGKSACFSVPTETSFGRFSVICHSHGPEKSICKIVCEAKDSGQILITFLPLLKINETGGYVPVPTNVKDIYTQFFQPIQAQTSMANDRMMVG